MRKKLYGVLLSLTMAVSALLSPVSVFATAQTTTTASDQTKTEPTEMEINYAKPVDSNKIDGWPTGPKVYAKSAIVMDVNTGAVLYAKNVDEALYPASITKIMTTMLAIENCPLDDQVTFSDNAINSLPWNCSRIGARVGEVFSMEDCLYAMMLSSANEVCIAVAEHVAGSEAAFADMMNAKAKELGCTNTHFVNSNGMPNEDHKTSAHDMALIAAAAFKNPTFQKVTGTLKHTIKPTNMSGENRYCTQHHKMLKENESFYYPYAVGGKTGFTQAALNTLVTYATKDDRTLVCVSLRTNGSQYYKDTASMLDYGFDNFTNLPIDTTDRFDTLQFPTQFYHLSPESGTDTGKHEITLPMDVSLQDVSSSGSVSGTTITHTYTWHDTTVGTFSTDVSDLFKSLTDPASVSYQSAQEMPRLLKSAHAKSSMESSSESSSHVPGFISLLTENLTGWQLGLCGVLVIAIILYIVILVRTIIRGVQRRKRRRRKARRQAASQSAGKKSARRSKTSARGKNSGARTTTRKK